MKSWCLGILVIVLAVAMTPAEAQYYSATVRCDSRDYRTQWCHADTSGGVYLIDQRSDQPCIEGESWGYDQRGIWVSGGCRGEFELGAAGYAGGYYEDGYADHGPGYARPFPGAGLPPAGYGYDDGYYEPAGRGYSRGSVVHCASYDRRPQYCAVRIRRGVEITRRLSDARCDYGRSWGYDHRGIWVSHGCRAQFLVK